MTGVFTGVLMFVYFVGFEVTQGWTLGKKLLGLQVHGPGGAAKPTVQSIRHTQRLHVVARSSRLSAACSAFVAIVDRGDHQQQPDQAGQARRLAGGTQVVKG